MSERLDTLMELYLLNDASEAELAELEEMLRADADARLRFVRMAGMEAALHRLGAETREARKMAPNYRSWKRTGALAIAAIVAVLIGLGIWWSVRDDRAQPAAPRVQVVQGAFEVEGKPVAGVELGTWMKAVAASDVRMADGTRAGFEAGSEVVLRESRSGSPDVEVRTGAGRFEVMKKVAGSDAFVVETPMGRARVLGTRFGVRVAHGAMVVEVEEGRVKVESAAEPGRSWVVGAGDSRVVLQKETPRGARDGEKKRKVITGAFGGVTDGELQLLRGDARNATGHRLAADGVVVIDRRVGKLEEIPEGTTVSAMLTGGEGTSVGVLVAKGPTVTGKVLKTEGGMLTLGLGKERVREVPYKMAAGVSVVINGKLAEVSELRAGMSATIQLSVRGDEVLDVTVGG